MLYTVNEIAEMTRLSTRTIRRYLKDGTLQGKKIGGQWRFTAQDYDNFLDSASYTDTRKQATHELVRRYLENDDTLIKTSTSQTFSIVFLAFTSIKELEDAKNKILTTFNCHYQKKGNTLELNVVSSLTLKVTYHGDPRFLQNLFY